MLRALFVCLLFVLLAACSDRQQSSGSEMASSSPLLCGKDTDCKGDRICEGGKCVDATPAQTAAATQTAAPVTAGVQPEVRTDQGPIPVCRSGDGRTSIPVWKPSVDADGDLSSDPPQKDGMIVYIELYQDASKVECEEGKLNAFTRPENPEDAMAGGLSVNLRGNTQFANGICYFRGYYMNEDVMGMHQGWIETYFGAVDKQTVVMSDKYCLADSLQ